MKEKQFAINLSDKFIGIVSSDESHSVLENCNRCALICIDEMIKVVTEPGQKIFLREVKIELENL